MRANNRNKYLCSLKSFDISDDCCVEVVLIEIDNELGIDIREYRKCKKGSKSYSKDWIIVKQSILSKYEYLLGQGK